MALMKLQQLNQLLIEQLQRLQAERHQDIQDLQDRIGFLEKREAALVAEVTWREEVMTNSKGETFVALSQENHRLKQTIKQLETKVGQLESTVVEQERKLKQVEAEQQPAPVRTQPTSSPLLLQGIPQFENTQISSTPYTNTVLRYPNSTASPHSKPHPSTTPLNQNTPNKPPRRNSRPRPVTPPSAPIKNSWERSEPAMPPSSNVGAANPKVVTHREATPPSSASPEDSTLTPPPRLVPTTPPFSPPPLDDNVFTPPVLATPPSAMSSPISLPPTPPSATPPEAMLPTTAPHQVKAQRSVTLQWEPEVYVGVHMVRGSTAYNHTQTEVYLSCPHSQHIHSYNSSTKQWARYQPKCPHLFFGMTVALGLVTSIGGQQGKTTTPKVLSLLDKGEEGGGVAWQELFPPMSTARLTPTATTLHPATCQETVLVVGGVAASGDPLSSVEVLHIQTRQWSSVSDLPTPVPDMLSCTIATDQLYLMGGSNNRHVYTCSLHQLLNTPPHTKGVWLQLPDTPTHAPSGMVIKNQLLAVGGFDNKGADSADIFQFQPASNSWKIVSHMKKACNKPLLANLPRGTLMVMGGSTKVNHITNVVQTAEVFCS